MPKIKHRRRQGYSTVSNTPYDDRRLQLESMGVFQLLWHLPDDWSFNEIDIVQRSASGRTKLRKALDELERFGYLKRSRLRNEKGQLTAGDWVLDDLGTLGDNSVLAKKKRMERKKSRKHQVKFYSWVQKPMFCFMTLAYFSPKTYVTFSNIGVFYRKPMSRFPMLDNVLLLITHSTNYSVSSKYAASKAAQTEGQILAKNRSEHSLDDPKGVSQAKNLWNDIWGKPSLFVEKQISQWVNEFGIDVVAHAFNYAKWKVEQASAAGSYLAKVFDNYRQNNVQTASQAAEADAMNLHRSKLSQRAKQSDSTTTPSKGESSRKDDLKNLIKDEPEAICYRAARLAKINLSGADQQALNEFVRRLGPKLVLNAIEVAKQETRYQYPSWGFLRSILRRYEAQGIKTVEDVKSDDRNTPSKGNSKQYKRHKPIKEPMPEWSRKPQEELYKKADPEAIRKLKERIANRNKRRKEVSG